MSRHNLRMHYVMVSGYPMPAPFGGHPALEFCNTWAGWENPPAGAGIDPRREYLADYDRLAVWAGHAGLLPDEQVRSLRADALERPDRAATVHRQARRLRNAVYALMLDLSDRAGFEEVSRLADRAVRATRLELFAEGPRRVLPESVGLPAPVLAAARAAEDLLSGAMATAVRACPGEDCGWLFLNVNGRRRWCSMSSCGNRSKVRAHAARR